MIRRTCGIWVLLTEAVEGGAGGSREQPSEVKSLPRFSGRGTYRLTASRRCELFLEVPSTQHGTAGFYKAASSPPLSGAMSPVTTAADPTMQC